MGVVGIEDTQELQRQALLKERLLKKDRKLMHRLINLGTSGSNLVEIIATGEGLEELQADVHRIQAGKNMGRAVHCQHALPYRSLDDSERGVSARKRNVGRNSGFGAQDCTGTLPDIIRRAARNIDLRVFAIKADLREWRRG
jgi:hypothetical protein